MSRPLMPVGVVVVVAVVALIGTLPTCVAAQALTFATTPTGLAASYAMSSGTDSSGNTRTATLLNTTTVAGKYGEGQRFNGQARMTIPTFNVGAAFTLEAWVYLGQLTRDVVGSHDLPSTGWQAIIYKGYDNVYMAEAGKFFTAGFTAVGGTAVQLATPTQLATTNAWHHLAFTYTGGTTAAPGTLTLWVDSVSVATQKASGAVAASPQPFEIGGSAIDGGSLNGIIDDVRIYTRALSNAEIASDMATPIDTVREPVVSWDMDVWKAVVPTDPATNQLIGQANFLRSTALCNLAPLPPPPPPVPIVVNPTKARLADPDLAGKECELIIQTFIEGLPVGLGYTSTLRAKGATTQSDRSSASNPFDRVAAAVPPLPPGPPVVR